MVNHPSGRRRRRRRLPRPVTVHDMMSYSYSNHGLDNLPRSLKSAGPMECARINGRTGGYDIPNNLMLEPDDGTDASTVKADNTTTATSKELLRFRFTNHTKRTTKCTTEDTSVGEAFSVTSSINSSTIDRKLRTRLPRLLKGGLKRFNLIRTLDGSNETFSEESLEEPVIRQRFVLPDEAPPPVPNRPSPIPRSRPMANLRPKIGLSMSSDSEAIEVLTHGDDSTAMIMNSSSPTLVAQKDDDRSSVGGGTYFSGVSSVISAISDRRLMDSSEKGSLRLTTDSLKYHDERQGSPDKQKMQASPPRRLRRPLVWLRLAMQQPEKVQPMDENEARRIEKMRQDYLAKQRARELEAISKEQRDRVFRSICSSSATERKEILRDVLNEAKAKASALAPNGYAQPPLVRSTGASVMTMDRCGMGCSAADNVFPSFGV